MSIKMKKEEVLRVLREQRRVAAAIDRKAAAEYKKKRTAAITARRNQLREFAKLPDDKLAELNFGRYDGASLIEVPGCPMSVLTQVERTITRIQLDSRQTMTFDESEPTARLLTMTDGPVRSTICETMSAGGDES